MQHPPQSVVANDSDRFAASPRAEILRAGTCNHDLSFLMEEHDGLNNLSSSGISSCHLRQQRVGLKEQKIDAFARLMSF
ncbi:hypothetical protein [Bradyrhizobium ivorense]|uniref:hypothetical protein n=1 Tax=Bradyrhizobium ivorense TaxID=2511166 RepID=UPI0011161189|nr:hypothetical protein [Bradyrhizobium ivorense]